MAENIALPELEVIQRFSLAVRSATAPREDVIAALQADLATLTTGDRRPTPAPKRSPRPREAPASGASPA